jgi:hypothetical protein
LKLFSKAVNLFNKAPLLAQMVILLALIALGFLIAATLVVGFMFREAIINDFLQALPSDYPVPPHEIKVDLSEKGNVYKTMIRVRIEEGVYMFHLKFIVKRFEEDGGFDSNQMTKLLGQDYFDYGRNVSLPEDSKYGVLIPVKLKVCKKDSAKCAVDKIFSTRAVFGRGINYIARGIEDRRLERGVYHIGLETLEDFPYLNDREVYLDIRRWVVK